MGESATRQQAAFDALITAVLARFASGTAAEVESHIQTSLREIAEFVGVDYAFIGRTSEDLSCWSLAYEWCSPDTPSQLASHQNVPMGTYDWTERVLLAGEVVLLNRLDDIPPGEDGIRQRIESLGFKSTLQTPMRGPGGRISGCIALSSLAREITWTEADVARLKLVGDAIATAIERAHVEKERRHSEARFRTIFEWAPVGILNVAPDGRLLRANQRFCELLGYSHQEVLGRHSSDFTHPDDLRITAALYDDLLAGRDAVPTLEKRYLRKDGQVVWGNLTLSRLFEDGSEHQVIVAVIEDITARKQSEETFDAVPDLIYVADRHQRIVRANLATAQRLGVRKEDVLGRFCHEIIRDDAGMPEVSSHGQLAADGRPHQFEMHEPGLGGDFLVSCTPLHDARGQLTGTVHVARDVTELRRSEAALRQAHEKLSQRRALVAAASLDGVWEWEALSEQVHYSKRFAELLGYDAAEVPHTLDWFRSILHPDDAQMLWTAIDRHLTQGAAYDVECRLRTKTGNYRWFRTRGQAQRDAEGRPTWMAGSLQDIHQQKTAETDLRKALCDIQELTQQLRAENVYLQEEITSSLGFDEIVGESDVLRQVLTQIEHVAGTDASVLLLGETGTGKELLARALHERSPRKQRSLVKVNLAALPSSLIESELFGHVKGAFTGAITNKPGRFQLADGGTLLLDEIGELDPDLQMKLLRVLQEGEFERIGSGETIRVDVRLVAATNRDLRRAMEQGRFRRDLYYRLAVFPIEVPPLRLRRDDIPLLTWHFIGRKQGRLGKSIQHVPDEVMQALTEYDWPGNIRELENVVERAMILSTGTTLNLTEPLQPLLHSLPTTAAAPDQIDRDQILAALDASHWKVKGPGNAAERLGLKPSTLRYRMKVLGIQRPDRK